MHTSNTSINHSTEISEEELDRIRSELSDQMALDLLPAFLILGIIMFIGFIGNCLVFYVYYVKFTPSSARSAILTLAFYDILTCIISIPGEIVDMRYSYSFTSEFICRGLRLVTTVILVASGLLLVTVAVDRYQRICRPLHDHLTSKDIWKRIVILGLLACVIAAPSPIMYGLAQTPVSRNNQTLYGLECSTSQSLKNSPLQMAYSVLLLLVFLVAFAIMIIIYILIGKQVLRQNTFRKAVRSGSLPAININKIQRSSSSQQENNEPSFVEIKDSSALHEMEQEKESPSLNMEPVPRKNDERKSLSRRQSVMIRIRKVSRPGDARTRKTTTMLFFITMVFVISFLPHIILKAIQAFNKNFDQSLNTAGIITYNIMVRSYFFNTVVNCFIYGFCSPKFRSECRAIVLSLAFWIKQRRASIQSDDIQ